MSEPKPTARPEEKGRVSEAPLTEAELCALWDEAKREVEECLAAGVDPLSGLPPELVESIRPSIEALGKLFGAPDGSPSNI